MAIQPRFSRTNRFFHILMILTMGAPAADFLVGVSSTLATLNLVQAGASVLAVGALAVGRLRRPSWGAMLLVGLATLIVEPLAIEGLVVTILATFVIVDSGWSLSWSRLSGLGLVATVGMAQVLSVVFAPDWLPLLARWILLDGFLVILGITFRQELFRRERPSRPVVQLASFGLNPRELQTVHLVWGGETPKQIAAILGSSESTIRKTLSRIYVKMGIVDLKELASFVHTHQVLLDRSLPLPPNQAI